MPTAPIATPAAPGSAYCLVLMRAYTYEAQYFNCVILLSGIKVLYYIIFCYIVLYNYIIFITVFYYTYYIILCSL